MTELLPLLIFLLVFGFACFMAGRRSVRTMMPRPTSLQRALSDCVSNEIRVARSQGHFDGWNLAHRTDSEGGNVSGSPVTTISTK
jgi:hypothetical protein